MGSFVLVLVLGALATAAQPLHVVPAEVPVATVGAGSTHPVFVTLALRADGVAAAGNATRLAFRMEGSDTRSRGLRMRRSVSCTYAATLPPDGTTNLPAHEAALFGADDFVVAVEPTALRLRIDAQPGYLLQRPPRPPKSRLLPQAGVADLVTCVVLPDGFAVTSRVNASIAAAFTVTLAEAPPPATLRVPPALFTDSIVATAVLTTVAGAVCAEAAGALQAVRAAALYELELCEYRLADRLNSVVHPLQFDLAAASSNVPKHLGAMLGNLVLIVSIALGHGAVALFTTQPFPWHGALVEVAAGATRGGACAVSALTAAAQRGLLVGLVAFPSLTFVAGCFFYQATVTSTTAVLLHSNSDGHKTWAGFQVVLLALVSVVPLVVVRASPSARACRLPSVFRVDVGRSQLRRMVLGPGEWRDGGGRSDRCPPSLVNCAPCSIGDRDALQRPAPGVSVANADMGYTQRMRSVFGAYRPAACAFAAVELGLAFADGVTAGVLPDDCHQVRVVCLTLRGVYALLLLVLQPAHSGVAAAAAVGVALLQTAAVATMLLEAAGAAPFGLAGRLVLAGVYAAAASSAMRLGVSAWRLVGAADEAPTEAALDALAANPLAPPLLLPVTLASNVAPVDGAAVAPPGAVWHVGAAAGHDTDASRVRELAMHDGQGDRYGFWYRRPTVAF